MKLRLIEEKQYTDKGIKCFLIFYIDGKKEGAALLYESKIWELPEAEKEICKTFNPVVDFGAIIKTDWQKEEEVEEDNIVEWLNSFGYEYSAIGKLY